MVSGRIPFASNAFSMFNLQHLFKSTHLQVDTATISLQESHSHMWLNGALGTG